MMIHPKTFFDALTNNGISFYTGVPDSLLKDFCAYITDHTTSENHVIAANEGGAVALATGYHLATEKIPLVYFQNSGLGNATNPLLSLASEGVYSIPMVLLIGWRGEPGTNDEPQHQVQGAVQNALLDAMEIPYFILDNRVNNVSGFLKPVIELASQHNKPVAIVVKKGVFQPYKSAYSNDPFEMTREEAIHEVLKYISPSSLVVSTTGKLSRELYEHRYFNHQSSKGDFLTVGSMGHASQIAMGIALNTDKTVYCLDGDGAAIMHMGAFAITGNSKAQNYIHVLFNNGSHESVGGQPTVGFKINFQQIAEACGYKQTFKVSNKKDIKMIFSVIEKNKGPVFVEIMISKGSKSGLMRPKNSPRENKIGFIHKLREL
ncbi:phosphonopyruvate decarboxylase [Saccharicrinis sp. FJH62]|uniref:phosphonopyruvate decarboxylase n=1 Tax=Saccharicrinis sp. FJH62 TaxID=3344657 RepID=UPI0035D447E9